jgi:hypothetical protein
MRQFVRLCLDPRVLVAFSALGVAVWLLAPGLLIGAIPLLIVLACPASMILMAVMMRPSASTTSDQAAPRHAGRIRSELADLDTRRSLLEAELNAAQEPVERSGPAAQAPRQEIVTR